MTYPIPVRRAGIACEMAIVARQKLAFAVVATFYLNGSQIGAVTLPANTEAYTVVWTTEFFSPEVALEVGNVLTCSYATSDGTALPTGVASALIRWNIDRTTKPVAGAADLSRAETSGSVVLL